MKNSTKIVLALLHLNPDGITSLDAWKMGGGSRLSGRILELRQAGYPIETEWVTTPNRARIARYKLVDATEQMVAGL